MARSATARVLRWPGAEWLVAQNAATAVFATALTAVQWGLLASMVAAVAGGGATPAEQLPALAGVLGAWSVRAGLAALGTRRNAARSSAVRASIRRALVDRLLVAGPSMLDRESSGELVGTATEGVTHLDALLARFFPSAVAATVAAPLLAATVLVLDPLSGVVLLVTGPLLVVLLWLVGTHADAVTRERWETFGRLGALLVDTLRTLPTLVTFGRAPAAVGWLTRTSEAYRATTLAVLKKAFLSGFVLELGASLGTALVAVGIGIRLFEGDLELGRGLFVLLLVPEFFAPLRTLGADHHARLEAAPAADRLFAVLDRLPSTAGGRPVRPGVPHLQLQAIQVCQDGREVLAGVDLDLPPGSRTALVGPSGAGKSTLAKVLIGLQSPTAGQVLLDGVPLAEYDQQSWRAKVAYLPERPWLAPGTVADNVRLGRPGASDAEVIRALDQAQALGWVRELPAGLDTVLGEDAARLSGGERLRLALARAFVADAAVLVLDEPTSQLDDAGEAAVLAAFDRVADRCTVLVITHRTRPLGYVERVVRLGDGAFAPVPEPA